MCVCGDERVRLLLSYLYPGIELKSVNIRRRHLLAIDGPQFMFRGECIDHCNTTDVLVCPRVLLWLSTLVCVYLSVSMCVSICVLLCI